MKKTKIKPSEINKLLDAHSLQKYDLCKICTVSATTVERWMKNGIPEAQFRLVKLSVGAL